MEGKEKESKHKHRLKGLFGKEKKPSTSEEVDDFLYGPSDKLNYPAPAPPPAPVSPPRLSRIDTASARRWPTTAELQNSNLARVRSASPKRSRKGLVVRFTNDRPEIIGEGGDEAELPTVTLSQRSRAHSHPPREQRSTDYRGTQTGQYEKPSGRDAGVTADFRPGPLRRTQTGFESMQNPQALPESRIPAQTTAPINENLANESHDAKSFAARVKADMRSEEGKALLHGANLDIASQQPSRPTPQSTGSFEPNSRLDEAQKNALNNVHISPPMGEPIQPVRSRPVTPQASQQMQGQGQNSRSSTSTTVNESPESVSRPTGSNMITESPVALSRSSTLTLQGAAIAVGDESLREFTSRVTHLFTLFRLSAETRQPLSRFSIEELVRVALWWFLKGRLHLEATVRDRPATHEGQQMIYFIRQQAFADLAKSLWLVEKVLPDFHDFPGQQDSNIPNLSELLNVREGIVSSLRKLTISMKRNNFLPPEEAPLPQGLDSTLWAQEEGNRSLLATQKQISSMPILISMPLGDSNQLFHYGRLFAKGSLMEDGDSQDYHCPMMATLARSPKEKNISMIITNQPGSLKLRVQSDKRQGLTWEDVEWHSASSTINLGLPRGFILRLQCTPQDFKTFWSMYDYENKVYGDFKPKQNEAIVFESDLKSFQNFDQGGSSMFPKESIQGCQLRIFESFSVQKSAIGVRNHHRGFRVGLITKPVNKVLRGISQELPPELPIQFGFLRGEGGFPAFLLKIDNGKLKYTMVFTFDDAKDRALLHARLTGVSLRTTETVITETQVKSFSVTIPKHENREWKCLNEFEWQSARVINDNEAKQQNGNSILTDHLRVVMDSKTGSLTDRINVEPGELKIRLEVTALNELRLLRNPQQDMTLSIVESQVSKDLPPQLAELLVNIAKAQSTRIYRFPGLKELHLFQAALTGFSVVFDGMASSFNISRRRMVVPIYKKWDAVTTRIQVVQREKVTQLVAFFENFSHGDCMNFTLKSTDVFESSSKNGKFSLRIVDAKFALPKDGGDEEACIDKGFVCLDMPEYPGEHDDITIVFDNEPDRESFMKALPAPVKAASRMASVRR